MLLVIVVPTRTTLHRVQPDPMCQRNDTPAFNFGAHSSLCVLRAATMGPVSGPSAANNPVAVHALVPLRVLRQMIYAYTTFHRSIEATLNELP